MAIEMNRQEWNDFMRRSQGLCEGVAAAKWGLGNQGFFVNPQSAIPWAKEVAASNPGIRSDAHLYELQHMRRLFQDEAAMAGLNFTRDEVFKLLNKPSAELKEQEQNRLKQIASMVFGETELYSTFGEGFVLNFPNDFIAKLMDYAPDQKKASSKLEQWQKTDAAKQANVFWERNVSEESPFDPTRKVTVPTKDDLRATMTQAMPRLTCGKNKLEDVLEVAYQIALSRGYEEMSKVGRYERAPGYAVGKYEVINTPSRIKDFFNGNVLRSLQELLQQSEKYNLPVRSIYLLHSIVYTNGRRLRDQQPYDMAKALIEALHKADFIDAEKDSASAVSSRVQQCIIDLVKTIRNYVHEDNAIYNYNGVGREINRANSAYQFTKLNYDTSQYGRNDDRIILSFERL